MLSSQRSCTQEGESAESWLSILEGLCDLCTGLGPKLAERADEDCSLDVFDAADLCALYQMAQSAEARTAVLGIATAFPQSTAVAGLRARSAVHLPSNDTANSSAGLGSSCRSRAIISPPLYLKRGFSCCRPISRAFGRCILALENAEEPLEAGELAVTLSCAMSSGDGSGLVTSLLDAVDLGRGGQHQAATQVASFVTAKRRH